MLTFRFFFSLCWLLAAKKSHKPVPIGRHQSVEQICAPCSSLPKPGIGLYTASGKVSCAVPRVSGVKDTVLLLFVSLRAHGGTTLMQRALQGENKQTVSIPELIALIRCPLPPTSCTLWLQLPFPWLSEVGMRVSPVALRSLKILAFLSWQQEGWKTLVMYF